MLATREKRIRYFRDDSLLPSFMEQKLEHSVAAISEESKRQHSDIMTALKNVRVYRQTLGQDQLSA